MKLQANEAMNSPHITKLITLEPGENVLMEVRRHMIVFYARILILVAFFFVPLFVSPLIVLGVNKIASNEIGTIIFGFLFTLWLAVIWMTFFYQWTDYYLDVWVITNKRIFDIDQKGFFNREISACRIEQLQDVSITVDGIMATFFKYGTVHIHTAGESHDFVIRDAADPMDVKNIILQAHGKTIDEIVVKTTPAESAH